MPACSASTATIVMPNSHPGHQGDAHRRLGRQGGAARRDAGRGRGARRRRWRPSDGLVFVHPYDDPAVMAGQGTLALELLQDAPDLDALVDPGRRRRPDRRLRGGRDRRCNPGIEVYRRRGRSLRADGAAPGGQAGLGRRRRPSPRASPCATSASCRSQVLPALVTEVLVVPERAVEEAIGLLAEGAKVVAEGAGAAGVAALLTFPERFRGRRVGMPVCGGNIDAAHPVQRAAAQPAARRPAAAAAHANPRPARRARRHRRQDRRLRRQHHRGLAPAAVRRRLRCRRPSWRSWSRRATSRRRRRS